MLHVWEVSTDTQSRNNGAWGFLQRRRVCAPRDGAAGFGPLRRCDARGLVTRGFYPAPAPGSQRHGGLRGKSCNLALTKACWLWKWDFGVLELGSPWKLGSGTAYFKVGAF